MSDEEIQEAIKYNLDYLEGNISIEDELEEAQKEIERLNNIINKAKEHMAENIVWRYQNEVIEELDNILQGSDKE